MFDNLRLIIKKDGEMEFTSSDAEDIIGTLLIEGKVNQISKVSNFNCIFILFIINSKIALNIIFLMR